MKTETTAKSDATAMEPSSRLAESESLEQAAKANLRGLGYGG